MASGSTSTAGMDGQSVSRKPSKLLARSNTLHRSPHGHSGSGAGLWLANSPSPKLANFPDAPDSNANASSNTSSMSQSRDSQHPASSQRESTQSGQRKKIYHFSADLARASFGGRPLTLAGSMDYDPVFANGATAAPSDDGDVDLDLSFDYISRFDSSSSSDQQDTSGSALDSSREREMHPPTSHFSPDDTPESLQAPAPRDMDPTTPAKTTLPAASTSSNSLSSSTGLSTSPSPNSKAVRSMQANADWDKRRKPPPAPLNLTPGSEAKRQRQLAMQKLQPRSHSEKPTLPPLSTSNAGPTLDLHRASGELVGKSIFSPITPATGSMPFLNDFGASHAPEEPLPLTPLSATRRGAAVHQIPDGSQITPGPSTPSSHDDGSSESARIRRAASTSAARAMRKESSEALRRIPTAVAHSSSYASNATPVQSRRARSHSNRSFRASASLASLGPPPFPPPNEPLPSPALSPSFHEHSIPSTAAYHTANEANSTISKAGRTRPSVSSIDISEAARSLRSRTTQTHRSSLDSFRTAISDGMTVAASSTSISAGRRWAAEELSSLPPLPPLQRYEALFPGQDNWEAAQPPAGLEGPSVIVSNNLLGIGSASSATTASTLTSVPMALSSTVGSTATTMTWSMSDRSTPSTHHSPLTPFTPVFSDIMPGTANSSKTHLTAVTRPSISSELPQSTEMQAKIAARTEMGSLGEAAAALKEEANAQDEGRGSRNTEQWILTQRQRKALLQHEELASHQRLLEADQAAVRLSIRADERASQVLLSKTDDEAALEARSRQDSRSTDATDDDQHASARRTMVISTVSTPDESVDPFRFVSDQPSLMPAQSMERAASHNVVQASTAAAPMTRNRSGTTGPWPQSPLLLNFDLPQEEKKPAVQDAAASLAFTTVIHSSYATPQVDVQVQTSDEAQNGKFIAAQRESGIQGLGLDFDYSAPTTVSHIAQRGSAQEGVKGFAPITTDLLRQASRCMNRFPSHEAASPHLSIQMSPEADALHRTRSKSKEALLTRGSRQGLDQGPELDVGGPSPVLPNDCRSPRTVSGKEVGSSAPSGLSAIVNSDITVHRAQLPAQRDLLPSQSIASSISAFVYNATPAPAAPDTDAGPQHLNVPAKPKTGSIGWRRNARRSRDHAQTLGLGMRPPNDSADVKFVNIDLDDGGLETEVTLDRDDAARSGDAAKAGQWVSKLWNAMASPRRTSFNTSAASGDRSVDLELANNSGDKSAEKQSEPKTSSVSNRGERTASRGAFRPLSLVEKRQSSGRYNLDMSRQRLRSPTPGEEDEVAEKDARAVALRLLAGSPRLAPPAEEGSVEAAGEQSVDRADLSAEEREKERIEALKKLRRMSAVERQRKRSSGIGYITTTSIAAESTRLPYVHDTSADADQHAADTSVRHGGLSRAGSVKNKRMSVTLFGGKERATALPASTDPEAAAAGPERAWLDAMRSPRVADSPSGFTPRMMFEPHDWGAASESQQLHQQQHGYGRHPPSTGSAANHIPLMLSSSANASRQVLSPASSTANNHGLTVSELDRARDEMRRLAGQGTGWQEDASAHDAGETFHTPMPDLGDGWASAAYQDRRQYVDAAAADFEQAHHHSSALGDFGISPEKNEARLHRRTRTARFAVDEHIEQDDDQPTVSIFTRSHHRHRASGSFSLPAQTPLTANRNRSKRRGTDHYAAASGHGLFATPAALLDSNAPSKNMFWAGFLGMPWLWMIGGWYLTPDGQLRHPSTDERKVDVWQHEPSMQHASSATSSPNPGSSSTTFGGSSYEQSWGGQGEGTSGLGLAGMSYAPSSSGTANSTKTTTSDPNRPPPSKTRKSKTRSLGSLLDSNPQVSFYQSPVRVVQEPQPSFGGVWRKMEPLTEVEEPRRSRIFAGTPDAEHLFAPSPASTTTLITEPKVEVGARCQVAVAHRGTQWKDLERYVLLNRVAAILSGVLVFAGFTGAIYAVQQHQQRQQEQQRQRSRVESSADVFDRTRRQDRRDEEEEVGAKRGLTSWDAVRWLSRQPAPVSPTKAKSTASDIGAPTSATNSTNSSLLMAGAAAALAATSSASSCGTSGLGGLLTALLNPNSLSTVTSSATQEGATLLSTVSHLVFIRAIFRIVFRVLVLVRVARLRNSATPLSALVLNELLR